MNNLQQLINYLNKERVIIIITGISGSGKTTLLYKLKNSLVKQKVFYGEVDSYKIREYEKYCFCNITEKNILKNIAIETFKADVIQKARHGINMVLDYPFNPKWQEFFDYIHFEYKYAIVVVNCNSRSFDDIIRKKIVRDANDFTRHKSLICSRYIDDTDYCISDKLSDDGIKKQQELYDSGYYNAIHGQVSISI